MREFVLPLPPHRPPSPPTAPFICSRPAIIHFLIFFVFLHFEFHIFTGWACTCYGFPDSNYSVECDGPDLLFVSFLPFRLRRLFQGPSLLVFPNPIGFDRPLHRWHRNSLSPCCNAVMWCTTIPSPTRDHSDRTRSRRVTRSKARLGPGVQKWRERVEILSSSPVAFTPPQASLSMSVTLVTSSHE